MKLKKKYNKWFKQIQGIQIWEGFEGVWISNVFMEENINGFSNVCKSYMIDILLE